MIIDKPVVDMDEVVEGIVDLAMSGVTEREDDINIDMNDTTVGEDDEIVVDEEEKSESEETDSDSGESSTNSDDSDDTEDSDSDESFGTIIYTLEDLVGVEKDEEKSQETEGENLEEKEDNKIKEVKSSLTEDERKAKLDEILKRREKAKEVADVEAMVEAKSGGIAAEISKEHKKPFEPKLIEWNGETMRRTTRMSLEKSTPQDFGKKVKSQVFKVNDRNPNMLGGRTVTNKTNSYDLFDKNSNLRQFERTPAEKLNIESNMKESSIMDCVRKEVEKQKVVKTLGAHSLKESEEFTDGDEDENNVTLADFLKGPAQKRMRSDNFDVPSVRQERKVLEREKVYMISTGAGSVEATRAPAGGRFERVKEKIKEIRDTKSYDEIDDILKQMVVNAVGTNDLEKLEEDVRVTFTFEFNITKNNNRVSPYKSTY